MSEKDRLLRLLDEAHDRGYESEEDAAAAAAEEEELQQQQQSVHVIDAGAGGDGPGIGGASGVGVSVSVPEVKQMADHGAQTLIPSLGRESRSLHRLSLFSSAAIVLTSHLDSFLISDIYF